MSTLCIGITRIQSTQLYPSQHQPGDAGLPMLLVESRQARAVIALQGAHVMSFQPKGQREMLWVSPKTLFESGKPIRGGIPLCLPWFGPHSEDKTWLHGFARTRPWTLVGSDTLADGATRLVLELSGDATLCALWPHDFLFHLEIVVGKTLRLEMTVENRGQTPAPLAFAFHTYFSVPDVAKAVISGLEGTSFIDKTDNLARKTQQGEFALDAMTDRIYLDVPAKQRIKSEDGAITIESTSKCAVVWNAWHNDKNIGDIGEGNHVGYVCVERGDAADHAVTLAPGTKYRCWMVLALA